MSWDSYIDTIIGQSEGHTDKACMIGLDGSKYTTDGHEHSLKITGDEAQLIGSRFTTSHFQPFYLENIFCEQVKYKFLRVEEPNIVFGRSNDGVGITLQSSKTCVVIATTLEGGIQGSTAKAVAIVVEYLNSIDQ